MNSRFAFIFLAFAITLSFLTGCEKLSQQDIYQRPDWLPGKLYTTVSAQENLSMFADCIKLTGLDSILDVSGIWSVFAPTNAAMQQYLTENQYASISDIPLDELERITEFHIVQNPWSLEQLQTLGYDGWITDEDEEEKSYALKRQTILKNPVEKYWVKKNHRSEEMIVMDSLASDFYKRVFVQSRKYVPIFYDDYMDANGLTSDDFSFYFDRAYERGNVYYAGAKVLHADIFAENGFVHVIDKVVDPMLNAKEILETENPGESYKLFLEMVYWYYPDFDANMPATYNQPSVRQGGLVDTLWDLSFSNPVFAIHQELIGAKGPDFNETLIRHNGLVAPVDEAFREFVDGVLTANSGFPHWGDAQSLPDDVVEIIMDRHFDFSPMYPSNKFYKRIFRWNNGFRQKEEDIIRKNFGSNCTFIGLSSYNPDQVFTSVTGPVFCRPAYSVFRKALLYTGTYDDIAYHDGELYFFALSNGTMAQDSSLIINWIDRDADVYNFLRLNTRTEKLEVIGRNTLKNIILNQVGVQVPNGDPNKRSFQTLGGEYITWDLSKNTVWGDLPCRIWNTGEIVDCIPVPFGEPTDNGKAYSVKYWFSFRGI